MRTCWSHSHVAGLLRRFAVGVLGQTGPGPIVSDLDTLHAPIAYSEPHRQWLAEVYLGALREEVESRGGRFLAFYIPSAAEVAALRRTGVPTEDETAFLRIIRRLGADGMAFTRPLAETDAPIASLYYPETHWRPIGHRIAARTMTDPVQAAVCTQDPAQDGCAAAPLDVRRVVEGAHRPPAGRMRTS